MNKKFNYKFTPTTIILCICGLLLSTGCVALNINRLLILLKSDVASTSNYLSCGLAVLIGLLGFVVITSFVFASSYKVTDSHFIVSWGIVKNKIEISKITRITFFRVSGKLVVIYDNDSIVNVCIKQEEFDELVDAIKSVNKNVFYSYDSENKGE